MPSNQSKLIFRRTAAVIVLALVLNNTSSAASGEKTVYSFCSIQNCADGTYPESGVIFDSLGNLYGTTNAGGAGFGAVFRLTPDAMGNWTESNVYTFSSPLDGDGPNGLVFDDVGNLYGTTIYGGGGGTCSNGGCGTVFELIPANGGWTKKVLFSFTGGNDGGAPLSGLILNQAGTLYGTTSQGGFYGAGTIFELTHSGNGWTERVIHSFGAGNDGRMPMSGLIFDKSGNLFGTANQGGTGNRGVVFALRHTKQGWKEIILHDFSNSGNDGAGPYVGSLAFDQAGNLYGTTEGGGTNGLGTVFELTRSNHGITERVLYSFLGSDDGMAPYTGVIIDATGSLYGTTSFGGNGGDGAVFTLRNSGGKWNLTVLYGFSGHDGSEPIGNLVFDGAGNFCGTASLGGVTGSGNVFEMTP